MKKIYMLEISVQTGCVSRLARNVKESQRNLPVYSAFFFFCGFWYQDLWNSNDNSTPQMMPAFDDFVIIPPGLICGNMDTLSDKQAALLIIF